MRKLLKKHGLAPDVLVTDKLRSYAAAKSELRLTARHEQGRRRNNRAENSHLPVRRRAREGHRVVSAVVDPSTRYRALSGTGSKPQSGAMHSKGKRQPNRVLLSLRKKH